MVCFLSADDDEFDTFDATAAEPLCQARAIYDYAAQQPDELTIAPGLWSIIVPLTF